MKDERLREGEKNYVYWLSMTEDFFGLKRRVSVRSQVKQNIRQEIGHKEEDDSKILRN